MNHFLKTFYSFFTIMLVFVTSKLHCYVTHHVTNTNFSWAKAILSSTKYAFVSSPARTRPAVVGVIVSLCCAAAAFLPFHRIQLYPLLPFLSLFNGCQVWGILTEPLSVSLHLCILLFLLMHPQTFLKHISFLILWQPPRSAHPVVRFSCVDCEPMVIDKLPFDKYELEPSPLTQYILERKSPHMCWQVRLWTSRWFTPRKKNHISKYI